MAVINETKLLAGDGRPRSSVFWAAFFSVLLLVPGCGNSESEEPQAPSSVTMQRWAASCALCHVSGVAGAPIAGDAQAWESRLEKGLPQLLAHTIEGFNKMPPLGYCMSCEAEDFVSMIEFMAELDQGALRGDAP